MVMDWLGMFTLFLPTFLLFLMGYLVRFRKMYWLISGYNTMSAEKKKNVDTVNLSVLIGNMCFVLGGIMFVGFLLLYFEVFPLGIMVLALFFPVIIYTIITAQKYDGNNFHDSGQMKTGSKVIVGIIVVSLLVLLGFIGSSIMKDMQPIAISLDQDSLTIPGSYGQTIPVADIQEIQLVEGLPEILRRTNGSAVGYVLRGNFLMAGVGPVKLYLDREKPPFIYLVTSNQKIFLNDTTPELTRALFETLKAKLDS